MVSDAIMCMCNTGIYALRTYLWGKTFLKNYFCERTELHQNIFQTFLFCMTSWQNMEAIFRCKCFHILKHILNYCKNFEKHSTGEQNATLDANYWIMDITPFHLWWYYYWNWRFIWSSIRFRRKSIIKETPYTEFWVRLQNEPEHRSIAKGHFLFSFKCPQRIYAKIFFLLCVRSNLAKEI